MRKGRIARTERVARANVRIEARKTRTSQQQLIILDEKLGTDIGAIRERKRLSGETVSHSNLGTNKLATTKSQRRKEKADRHARRKENDNPG